jgi:ribosomal subunit interface protein
MGDIRVSVAGRQMDVGEALRGRILEDLSKGVQKYFSHGAEASVTIAREGHLFDVDCVVHLDSGITLEAHGEGGDAHAAFDSALSKIEKRVRRYKRRLKNHHAAHKTPLPEEPVPAYVLRADEGEEEGAEPVPAEDGPMIIAEMTEPVRTMAVATAVMQLELKDAPALLFRNAAHGGLNMVYRRRDGHVGWIDPPQGAGVAN